MNARRILLALLITAAVVLIFSAMAQQSYAPRRERIEGMTDEQKRALNEEWEYFNELSPEKRKEINRLHARLQADPEQKSLETLLVRYHEWVETLPWYTRAELQDLSTEARIARIRELREEECLHSLSPTDRRQFLTWILRQLQQVGADIPPEEIESLSKIDPRQRQERLKEYFRKYGRRMFDRRSNQRREAAIVELLAQLSPRVRKAMEKKNSQDQGRIVFHWTMEALGSPPGGRPSFGGPNREIGNFELRRFFIESLPPNDRQRLLSLPAETQKQELRKLYLERRSRQPGRMPSEFHGPRHDRRGPLGRGEGGRGEGGRGEGDRGEAGRGEGSRGGREGRRDEGRGLFRRPHDDRPRPEPTAEPMPEPEPGPRRNEPSPFAR